MRGMNAGDVHGRLIRQYSARLFYPSRKEMDFLRFNVRPSPPRLLTRRRSLHRNCYFTSSYCRPSSLRQGIRSIGSVSSATLCTSVHSHMHFSLISSTILLYAVVGTMVSTFLVGFLTFYAGKVGFMSFFISISAFCVVGLDRHRLVQPP